MLTTEGSLTGCPKSPTPWSQVFQLACEVTQMQGIVRSRVFTTSMPHLTEMDSAAWTQIAHKVENQGVFSLVDLSFQIH